MSSYLIIDGYNIINRWPVLLEAKEKSIEFACSELFYVIQRYADAKELKAIIVYDGRGKERTVEDGNPTVIYSKKQETADTVIESLVYNAQSDFEEEGSKKKTNFNIRIVTDDRSITNMVLGMGATVVSTNIFASELESGISSLREDIKKHSSSFKRGLDL